MTIDRHDESRAQGTGPLSKLRVLDLSTFLAGPFCTMVLGDLGALIIKIEPPTGDQTRALPPYYYQGEGAYFLSCNRNKKSVVLDLRSSSGKSHLSDLLTDVDVLVENFRPGVLETMGFSSDVLRSINPRLIHCAITGFGLDGPSSRRPAYDMVVQALSGVMSLTGPREGPSVRTGVPLGDLAAGLFAAIGILAAVHDRASNGVGQVVDVAMLDSQVAMLSYLGVYHLISGEVPGRQGREHVSIPTYRAFVAADGLEFVVTANTERMWTNLCVGLGLVELSSDPRFRTNALRHQNRDVLVPLLEDKIRRRPRGHWLARLADVDVPAAPINNVKEALEEPQILHRGMVVEVEHALGGMIRLLGNPVKLSNHPTLPLVSPPLLGQHTDEVLTTRGSRRERKVL
jgi:CoA:oxalate CoA-transferase